MGQAIHADAADNPVALPARAVAVLLVGKAAARALKRRWDRRVSFYPSCLRRGRGRRPHLYDAARLVLAAVAAGDASAAEATQSLKIIEEIATMRGHRASTP